MILNTRGNSVGLSVGIGSLDTAGAGKIADCFKTVGNGADCFGSLNALGINFLL